MLLRSPGPISPDTYSGHIRRRALCPNRRRNGMSQRSSSSRQSDILPTMVGPSKSRPPMSHRKTDLGIPCRSKSAKVVLGSMSLAPEVLRRMEGVGQALFEADCDGADHRPASSTRSKEPTSFSSTTSDSGSDRRIRIRCEEALVDKFVGMAVGAGDLGNTSVVERIVRTTAQHHAEP